MIKSIILMLGALFVGQVSYSGESIQESERLFDKSVDYILSKKVFASCQKIEVSCKRQKEILVDAVLYVHDEELMDKQALIDYLYKYEGKVMNLAITDQVRIFDVFFDLNLETTDRLGKRLKDNIRLAIDNKKLTERDRVTVCYYLKKLKDFCSDDEKSKSKTDFDPPSKEAARELLMTKKALKNFRGGKYVNKPQLYVLCRKDRRYHCLLTLKDSDEKFVINDDGSIWTLPVLGYSKKKRPYFKPDGDTPAGPMLILGVMPNTDKKLAYGDFRRLILDFVDHSEEESDLKSLLPFSSQKEEWWRESVVARDAGRAYLRIHGVGWKNFKSSSKWYPFVPTRGCLTTREGKYSGTNFKDQRVLLDEIMKAQGLIPKYSNETLIRGLIYTVNIDDKKQHVTEADLLSIIGE